MKSNYDKHEMPVAVVFGLTFSGYGIVRSLIQYGIPVVAFHQDFSQAESKTRLCEQIIAYNNNDDLLKKALQFAKNQSRKPVLFITADDQVELFIRHRDAFEAHFCIHYPSSDIVKMLFSKQTFTEYAITHNLLIPQSFIIKSKEELQLQLKQLIFPVIIKPLVKKAEWLAAKFKKAYFVDNKEALSQLYEKLEPVEPELIIQEWIPGPDSNVEYCLMYFNELSECIGYFTGAKIRQWLVGTGSTASTKPCKNDQICQQSIDLFKKLHYRGFGSVEYKKHAINGNYYITEPTVGRPNQQEYVATANGINLPLIAYESLTGFSFTHQPSKSGDIIYIDARNDLKSFLLLRKREPKNWKDYFSSVKGGKEWRYFDKRDLSVFIFRCLKVIIRNVREWWAERGKKLE